MLIKTLPVGYLDTNCYIVTDETTCKCVVIDPGADSNTILDYIESNKLTVEAVFLTHGHFDHQMALRAVLDATGVNAYIHKDEVAPSGSRRSGQLKLEFDDRLKYYDEGHIIQIGGLVFTVMLTPGHSAGSVTLRCENALFTGDTLFRGSCGRTDLGGSAADLLSSLKRLAELDGDFEVYPGHEEHTTLNRERSFNPFVIQAMK